MRKMILGIVVTVFACGEYFILESNTQDDANHAPAIKPVTVAGLQFSAKVETTKEGKTILVVLANNPGKATGKKKCRILLQETRTMVMSRMMPRPNRVWEKEIEVDLAPGEEKRFEFSDPRFASLSKSELKGFSQVLSEILVVSGKERAMLLSHPGNSGIPGQPTLELPEKIKAELSKSSPEKK